MDEEKKKTLLISVEYVMPFPMPQQTTPQRKSSSKKKVLKIEKVTACSLAQSSYTITLLRYTIHKHSHTEDTI